MFKIVLRIVGSLQLVLGIAYLFAADLLLKQMGHSLPAPDLHYPLGMLGARFVAYGAGFWVASQAPERNILLIRLMALIQGIDLLLGVYYSVVGVVPWTLSAFPMFNAVWILFFCAFWKPIGDTSPQA